MSDKKTEEKQKRSILKNNPYDLEVILNSIKISCDANKELVFMDKFITSMDNNKEEDATNRCYKILAEMNLIEFQ